MNTKLSVGWIIGTLIVACQWWYYLLETDNHIMMLICALIYWALVGIWSWNPFRIFHKNEENHDDRF